MARSAVNKADRAAEALDAFLRDRPSAPMCATPGPATSFTQEGEGLLGDGVALSSQRPARQADSTAIQGVSAGAPLRLPHTDWLFHRLAVNGPTATVAAFRAAAAGAGTIPWRLDGDSLEEDWFHLLVNPAHGMLSLAGARVLAGQLRDTVEHRHAVAVARVGRIRACPFDLHALAPVPAAILRSAPITPTPWYGFGSTGAPRRRCAT